MEVWIPAFQQLGYVAGRTGSRLPESTPNNLYPTADGEFIHITAMADAVFQRLAAVMAMPQLARDERFASGIARSQHHEAIDALIAEWTARHPLDELERMLQAANVPATRIYTMADIFRDPHYRARGSIVEAPDPDLGGVAMATPVPRLSATPGVVRHAGRRIGQDTRSVLSTLLGYSDENLDALAGSGVIACASEAPVLTGGA
jgi:crotonobetainyl-CoA:carnitine CoA-transferase CaiB-like acyl-CoA transferase